MAFDAHKNFAISAVTVAPSPPTTGTSLTVTTGEGALFPAVPFNATVTPPNVLSTSANSEIVRATARTGDVFTITRIRENSFARSIVVGDLFVASVTAKAFQDLEAGSFPLDVTAGRDLYEKARMTPVGHGINVVADSSYFAIGGAGTGNWAVPSVDTFTYSLVGQTLTLWVYVLNSTWYITANQINIKLPDARQASRAALGHGAVTATGIVWESCTGYALTNQSWVTIHRDTLATFPASSGNVNVFFQISLPVF